MVELQYVAIVLYLGWCLVSSLSSILADRDESTGPNC